MVFLRNIARVSGSTILRYYRWGHASEIEVVVDSEWLCQNEGANFGYDSTYYGGNQELGGDTSCFNNEHWSLPQRMDEYLVFNM